MTDALAALTEECEEVSKLVLSLSEDDFDRPTRCGEWNVKELLGHLYRGIDRLNTALAQPPPARADTDSVSYWGRYDPVDDSPLIAERAKEIVASYASGFELATDWDEMWRRAVDAARVESADRVVVTWGPKLTLDEFIKTRVLEVTVHRMDLEDALGRKGWGTDTAVGIVDEILTDLLGEEPPSELEWDAVDFIEVGTGRRRLTSEEREILGELAAKFPLLA